MIQQSYFLISSVYWLTLCEHVCACAHVLCSVYMCTYVGHPGMHGAHGVHVVDGY